MSDTAGSSMKGAADPSKHAAPRSDVEQACHILHIPPELRLMIYGFVLDDFDTREDTHIQLQHPTIISVCRLMGQESLPIYTAHLDNMAKASNERDRKIEADIQTLFRENFSGANGVGWMQDWDRIRIKHDWEYKLFNTVMNKWLSVLGFRSQ